MFFQETPNPSQGKKDKIILAYLLFRPAAVAATNKARTNSTIAVMRNAFRYPMPGSSQAALGKEEMSNMFTSTAAVAPAADNTLIPNTIPTIMPARPSFSGVTGVVESPASLRVRDVQSDESPGSAMTIESVQNLVNALSAQVVSAANLTETETPLVQVLDFGIPIVVCETAGSERPPCPSRHLL